MMNIVYSCDDNYARHAGISMTSLFECNKDADEINVYLIENCVGEVNRGKLDRVAEKYGRNIIYIPFEKYKPMLNLNNKWELPISAYARIFVGEMLPEDVDRVLYLDCDTIITDSLADLWKMDMQGNTIAAVEDVASCVFQHETGTPKAYRYICSGVILIDLKKWRKINALKKMLDYLDGRNGEVWHHDQTILNGVFWNDCFILHPRYDVLTPTFIMSYNNLIAYFNLWDRYYTKDEIRDSVNHPAIIHYTSANIGRPWENNAHPKAKIYQKYWKESEWKDEPWAIFKIAITKTEQHTYWFYRHFPVKFILGLLMKIKNTR